MTAQKASATTVRRCHVAVLTVFAVNGALFASWASRIPDVRELLHLRTDHLGLLLLCLSVGAVLGLPSSGWVNDRWGCRGATTGAAALAVSSFSVVGLATSVLHSVWVAGPLLVLAGVGMGVWDVSMNLEGSRVERRVERAVMPLYHAAFSGGTVTAALVGAGLSAAGVPVVIHLAGVAVLGALVLARAVPLFSDERETTATEGATRGRTAWTEPRTLLIGLVVLAAAFTEGTANDWLSVAFVDGHTLPNWAGVLAFAAFLTSMTVGRLLGPRLLARVGRVPVLRATFVTALVGNLLVVLGSSTVAYAGALLWGFGTALGFPVGMSAASDDPHRAARRLAVVSTVGYCAFLAGPPLLGFLGERAGVLHALLVVAGMVGLALLCVPAAREPEHETPA